MPWFKIDDNLAIHAKVVRAGNAAMGLWVRAGSWSAQQLTDGHVPDHIVTMLGTQTQAAKLVAAGLWHPSEKGGFVFHEWAERQPRREEVEGDRAAAKERMRLAREAKRSGKNAKTSPPEGKSSGKTDRARQKSASSQVSEVRSGEHSRTHLDLFGNPDPTRPDPTIEKRAHPTDGAGADEDTKPQTIEHRVTDWAYTKTDKAFDFIKTRAITKWAIHDKGADPNVVAKALVAVYEAGRPITKTTLGQYLDGHSPETKPDTRPGSSSWNRKLVPCNTCGGKHPEGAICE
jgi:hypothetical protein